jgi:Family of unknown function (DUF5330)
VALMKIIRTGLLLVGALVLLPSPPPATPGVSPESVASSWAMFAAAADTVADLKSFCRRQAAVCEAAEFVTAKVEAKAKYNFKLIYEWANQAAVEHQAVLTLQASEADAIMTGSLRDRTEPEADVELETRLHGSLLPDEG